MTISEAAREAQVGVETIRFYEREGYLAQPPKPQSGFRRYTLAHVARLKFLKQCQAYGFTLAEAVELAKAMDAGESPCEETCSLAERKLAAVRKDIAELTALAGRLEKLIDAPCRRKQNPSCQVMEALRSGSC
jgi:MerR family transcriptional regulator, mercuric resistance operon regulatory protein